MPLPRLAPLLLLLIFAGCAHPAEWTNAAFSPGQRDADETECRRTSEADLGPSAYTPPGSERFDTPLQMVDRSETRGRFDAMVTECMELKGYRRAP